MKTNRNYVIGFLMGGLFICCFIAALGAGNSQEKTTPMYSVQLLPGSTAIVNNATNKLYVYDNTETGAELRIVFDLAQAGKKKVANEKLDKD